MANHDNQRMPFTRYQAIKDPLLLACLSVVEVTETALIIDCTPHSVCMFTLHQTHIWLNVA